MKFTPTSIAGAVIIDIEPLPDERGFFARTYCPSELVNAGLRAHIAQSSMSFNRKKGTLRGMHYQAAPYDEIKMVRCTHGAIYDVVLDLRRDSPTYRQWTSVELTRENRRTLYIAPGLAHGFQTLVDDTEVQYQMSQVYVPEAARGVRWDDPAFGIAWPDDERTISTRDASYADFSD
jgi:dTDP-4-dehydrorhamnose 3,5-epimerase